MPVANSRNSVGLASVRSATRHMCQFQDLTVLAVYWHAFFAVANKFKPGRNGYDMW